MLVFAIYDKKAEGFGLPFFAPKEEVALRMFRGVCRDEKANLHHFPEDYSLMGLAAYNAQSGTFENLGTPELLAMATQYVKEQALEIQHAEAEEASKEEK